MNFYAICESGNTEPLDVIDAMNEDEAVDLYCSQVGMDFNLFSNFGYEVHRIS